VRLAGSNSTQSTLGQQITKNTVHQTKHVRTIQHTEVTRFKMWRIGCWKPGSENISLGRTDSKDVLGFLESKFGKLTVNNSFRTLE
jgi:hypothetical protein